MSDIRLAYEGVDRLTLDPEGGLQIGTAIGVLRDAPPVAFQEISGKRVPVASRYELTGQRTASQRIAMTPIAN